MRKDKHRLILSMECTGSIPRDPSVNTHSRQYYICPYLPGDEWEYHDVISYLHHGISLLTLVLPPWSTLFPNQRLYNIKITITIRKNLQCFLSILSGFETLNISWITWELPETLVKMQILTLQVWGGAWNSAYITSFQAMFILPVILDCNSM